MFGDIDVDDHKKWVKKVCNKTNILEYLPLWKKPRRKIVQEFINDEFKAIIVTVKDKLLDKELLGRELDENLIGILEKKVLTLPGKMVNIILW